VDPSWRGIAGALAGVVTMYSGSVLGVRAIVAVSGRLPFRSLAAGMSAMHLVSLASSASLGVLTGLASATRTLSAVFVIPPLAVIAFVLQQHARAVQGRQQLTRLLDTAAAASQSTSIAGVQDVQVDAACMLLHTADAHIGAGALWAAELLERVRHQAFHDTLTGLPNRLLFEDRVNQALKGSEQHAVGVLFVNLDLFKRVNDSLGHGPADILLQQVAERLQTTLRPSDSAARVGGDEFAVLLPEADSRSALEAARWINDAMRKPFVVQEQELVVTASVGVALSPDDGSTLRRCCVPLIWRCTTPSPRAATRHDGCSPGHEGEAGWRSRPSFVMLLPTMSCGSPTSPRSTWPAGGSSAWRRWSGGRTRLGASCVPTSSFLWPKSWG